MAWTITIEQLRAERDDMANRIGGTELYEQLARGHRWLDRHDKAERWFRTEVDELLEAEEAGGGDDRLRARIGGLLTLAGAPDEAEPWLRRALDSDGLDPAEHAGVHYLLGELLEAALIAPKSMPGALADAVREPDPAGLAADRAELLKILRIDRATPCDVAVGASVPWTEWDWIEESFLVEARLRGEDPPSHEQMLERLGLQGDPAPPLEIELVPGTHAEVMTEDELGDPVRTTITVKEGWVEVVLQPHPARYVRLDFECEDPGWAVRWLRDHDDDEGMWILDTVPTLSEAVERVSEWLAVDDPETTDPDDPYVPRGGWATAALDDLIAALRRGQA